MIKPREVFKCKRQGCSPRMGLSPSLQNSAVHFRSPPIRPQFLQSVKILTTSGNRSQLLSSLCSFSGSKVQITENFLKIHTHCPFYYYICPFISPSEHAFAVELASLPPYKQKQQPPQAPEGRVPICTPTSWGEAHSPEEGMQIAHNK